MHGDFWSGNIAKRGDNIFIIDWGDALWGVGSISIVNLLLSSDGKLSVCVDAIWEAYALGWEKGITGEFIRSSEVAHVIGNLMVDMEIAKCCGQNAVWTPGLFPNLDLLANLLNL